MFVIDFELVNAPREAFNVITVRHLNTQSQQQKHLGKSVKYVQGEITQRKMSVGIQWGKFSEWEVIVQRETV